MSKVKLNHAGVRALLRSQDMMGYCAEVAQGVARRAGTGYEINEYTGTNRVNVSVGAASGAAYRDNLRNNTLLKAIT